jgi:helicase
MVSELKIKEKYSDPAVNLAFDTIEIGKQAIIFANTKSSAEKTAEDIAKKIKSVENQDELDRLSEKILHSVSKPTKQCERLSLCVKKGIAFHHAGLTQGQKELIQDEFKSGNIKIISATPTLAAGVDLPAFRTVLKSLKRYSRRGMEFIPVLEYLQMAGRAGRPKYDSYGEAVVLAATDAEKEKLWEKYILGEPEDISSKLAAEPALRFYLLSLISGNFVRTKKDIMDFFEKTFWAHQYQDMDKLEMIIDRMLALLEDYGFIIRPDKKNKEPEKSYPADADDLFIDANEIVSYGLDDNKSLDKYSATILGRRVAELYLDPMTAHDLILAIGKAEKKIANVTPFSFLQMVSYTLEIRPLLSVKVKEYEDIMSQYAKFEGSIITKEPSRFDIDYDEFFNSIKTALFFHEWINEKTEDTLLEEYNIRPGEIKAKLDIADWLVYSSIELAKILLYREAIKHLFVVRTRLKYGAKEELMPLLKLKNIGRIRARMLYNNGYKDIGSLKKADMSSLKSLIGMKIAESIKEELGEKVEKVKKNKRKGQKNVDDY